MRWLWLARPLLAIPFVAGGLSHSKTAPLRQEAARRLGIPAPEQAAAADAVLKLVAGTMLGLGIRPRLTSIVLALDLVPTTVGAHRFWETDEPRERERGRQHVMLNCAVLGGLIAVAAAAGTGPAEP